MASSFHRRPQATRLARSICSTAPRLAGSGWLDKIKGVFTAGKTKPSFTLVDFANQMDSAREKRSFKNFSVGRCGEVTISKAFERQAEVVRFLGAIDPTGENLQRKQKQAAAEHCNCSLADVEHALSKYTWAKDAHNKIEKLKEEGRPLPKTFAEVQKLMGSSPVDVAKSNLAKTGRVSKNALCPCGSSKKYKRCCGTAEW